MTEGVKGFFTSLQGNEEVPGCSLLLHWFMSRLNQKKLKAIATSVMKCMSNFITGMEENFSLKTFKTTKQSTVEAQVKDYK